MSPNEEPLEDDAQTNGSTPDDPKDLDDEPDVDETDDEDENADENEAEEEDDDDDLDGSVGVPELA